MKFEKYTCWEPSEFKKVVHTEAEAIPDDVFLAVHTDNKINLSIYGNKQKDVTYNKFLSEFLEGDYGNNVQTVIEGESGSGKSHLVQWIRQHIPKTEKRYVLNIPKTETNLHSVLKNLIELLPDEKRIEYNTKLQKKDVGLNNDLERKHIFLSSLANSILMDKANDENEEYLKDQLPNIFNDPYFRDNYFNDHPIINNIISLIFDNSGINRNSDKRQEFLLKQLPLNAANAVKAAEPTREILAVMNEESDDLSNIALNIINRNLDKAISRTLNFTPDDLIELMSEIRRYLYKNDAELILLIEDFAQLQGVDTALLQVLTVDGTGELCKIKWAMAVTTGYFEKLEDTVRTRMTFKINMDSLWDKNDKGKQNEYILNLASKYLNAIRLGSKNIDDWYKNYNNGENSIPNKCDDCQHKSICIESFEEVNGVALYPFNKTALLSMARTADKEKTESFRPREFLNKVLHRNLNQLAKESINDGSYPDISLYNDFSIQRLSKEKLALLKSKDSVNYERILTLIELWSTSNQVVNFNKNIHTAFSLPIIEDIEEVVFDNTIEETTELEETFSNIKTVEINPVIEAIEKWSKGKELRDNEKQQLAKIVFSAIEANIKWDMLPVSKSLAMTLMSPRHISFQNQQTQKHRTGILLDIEASPENGIILEILYKINKQKSLPSNLNNVATFQNKIESWSNYFINELQKYFEEKDNWNPVNATIELLLINTVMNEKKLDVSGLFSEYIEVPMASNEFNSLLRNTFSNNTINAVLLETLQKTYTGRKGGDKTKSFIDAKKVLEVIASFKKNKYRLIQDPTKEDRKEFKEIANLYKNWKDEFNNVLDFELEERFNWLDSLSDRINIEDIGQSFRNKIKKLQEKLQGSGLNYRSSQLDSLMNCNIKRAKEAFENTAKLKEFNRGDIFVELFPSKKEDAIQFIKLIDVYEEYLSNAHNSIQSRSNEFNRQSNTKDVVNTINTYIVEIDKKLQKIEGDSDAS